MIDAFGGAPTRYLDGDEAAGLGRRPPNGADRLRSQDDDGEGFRFVTVSSDARMIAAGSQDILVAMRAK